MFPAESVGGPAFIKGVLAPRPWTRIMPSGGVSTDEDNLRAWFDAGAACVGMGSQLIRSAWIQAGKYDAIAQETSDVLARIRKIHAR
jgi:2-dehydro-3-deoxyphosphogluconate aldolase/(4S)-4-hydroxy-2-oxoglutarate aldolase